VCVCVCEKYKTNDFHLQFILVNGSDVSFWIYLAGHLGLEYKHCMKNIILLSVIFTRFNGKKMIRMYHKLTMENN
jgi:hypothetical protein